jgi:polyisoprenoid-binding protein YceI
MKRLIGLIVAVALMVPLYAQAATYTLDPAHTSVGFKVKHLMITNVKGVFEKFQGTMILDEKDITKSKISATIEVASINTNIAKRDDHLRSADFFDAAKYPVMTFESTKIEKVAADKLKVTGNLTIRGVTKPVVLAVEGLNQEVKSMQGGFKRGASATGTINRQDFGVSWNKRLDAGGVVVADEVHIIIDAQLDKK